MTGGRGELYIGLMSGTSLDGVDGVLVDFSNAALVVLEHSYHPFSSTFATELLALNSSSTDEFHRGALAGNALARTYAQVVAALLLKAGLTAKEITAVGAHGQTVRHRPQEFDGTGYTLQLNNPALLAELTNIDVVADFRNRDVAAGGQGAPLVPGFHLSFFGKNAKAVSVLNLGGISNLSALSGNTSEENVLGFDCGPGNALLDYWCQRHTGESFDRNGAWSARGELNETLLARLLSEPYFTKAPPKSTGRDLFSPAWLAARLDSVADMRPVDVQATLCEFTARACASSVHLYAPATKLLIVCGGGALNGDLMRRMRTLLPSVAVDLSSNHGLPPMQVEATAFAWLARKTIRRETASLQSVTGAKGARVLGAIYPR